MLKKWMAAAAALMLGTGAMAADFEGPTYAERLGWPEGTRAVIMHSDDLGMHRDANLGTIKAIEEGICNSASVMMPCGWVTQWRDWLEENPDFCNGLHITLTSEWQRYRWPPLSSYEETPGLFDADGYMHRSVAAVAANATPEEVRTEIMAQLNMARRMGMDITHLDTHMGTLFARPDYTQLYVEIGIQEQIPVMIMGGHMRRLVGDNPQYRARIDSARELAEHAWENGLPVLDDLQSDITGLGPYEEKKAELIKRLRELEPGVTQFIVHCTEPSEVFSDISGSGPNRWSDVEVLIDPEVQQVIEEEGIVLTTWRELHERRKALDD